MTRLVRLGLSILLGAFGGAVFYYFNMPLAWMLGSMTFTTIAALAGAPVTLHMPLRMAMAAILGTLLGSAFTPHILEQLQHWGAGVATMAVFVTVMTAVSVFFLFRVGKLDRATAYFAGTPGGLGEMTIIGEYRAATPERSPWCMLRGYSSWSSCCPSIWRTSPNWISPTPPACWPAARRRRAANC
jgi:membrane AbrB-like protein